MVALRFGLLKLDSPAGPSPSSRQSHRKKPAAGKASLPQRFNGLEFVHSISKLLTGKISCHHSRIDLTNINRRKTLTKSNSIRILRIRANVGNPIQNLPFGDGLHTISGDFWAWCIVGFKCSSRPLVDCRAPLEPTLATESIWNSPHSLLMRNILGPKPLVDRIC